VFDSTRRTNRTHDRVRWRGPARPSRSHLRSPPLVGPSPLEGERPRTPHTALAAFQYTSPPHLDSGVSPALVTATVRATSCLSRQVGGSAPTLGCVEIRPVNPSWASHRFVSLSALCSLLAAACRYWTALGSASAWVSPSSTSYRTVPPCRATAPLAFDGRVLRRVCMTTRFHPVPLQTLGTLAAGRPPVRRSASPSHRRTAPWVRRRHSVSIALAGLTVVAPVPTVLGLPTAPSPSPVLVALPCAPRERFRRPHASDPATRLRATRPKNTAPRPPAP